MSNICRFTVPASRDLEAIIDLVARKSGFNTAEFFLQKINQNCQALANSPTMGNRRDDIYPSMWSFPVDEYLILYRQIETGIEIVRVITA